MKSAVFTLAAFALLCGSPATPQDDSEPKVYSRAYSVLPGKTLNIRNRRFYVVEIRSEYPIQIAAGPCHNDYTVQWECTFDSPTDLFIRDLRLQPILRQPKANSITILAR